MEWPALFKSMILYRSSQHRDEDTKVLVLIIVPIGKTGATIWNENIRILNAHPEFHIFLSVYDSDLEFEPAANIVETVHRSGCKAEHWAAVPLSLTSRYDYVWVIDEDISLTDFDWPLFKKIILQCRPLVIQPSVKPLSPKGRSSDWKHLRYHKVDHDAEEVEHTEVQTCFLSSKLWEVVHHRLSNMDTTSVWGLDFFWSKVAWSCRTDVRPGPLVVFSTSVIHHDFKSMNNGRCVRKCIDGCKDATQEEVEKVNRLFQTNLTKLHGALQPCRQFHVISQLRSAQYRSTLSRASFPTTASAR